MLTLYLADSVDKVSCSHSEGLRDVKEPFVQNPTAAVLDVHQHVPRDPREQSELLLREVAFHAQMLDPGTNLTAPPLPGGDPLGVVLARTRRHAFQYSPRTPESLPH